MAENVGENICGWSLVRKNCQYDRGIHIRSGKNVAIEPTEQNKY